MPGEDDFFSNLLGQFLAPQSEEEAEEEAGYTAGRQANLASQQAAFRGTQTKIRHGQQMLEMQGQEPIGEPQSGFISRALDLLNTPQQMLYGATASMLGHPDYENLSLLEAADKGAAEDAHAGSLLREAPFFDEHGYLRGAVGFGVDVLTDPLNLISLGSGSGIRLGGKAVSEIPLASRFADEAIDQIAYRTPSELRQGILARKQVAAFNEASQLDPALGLGTVDLNNLDLIKENLLNRPQDELSEVIANRMAEVERQSSEPFQNARAFLSQQQEYKRTGIQELLDPEFARLAPEEVPGFVGPRQSEITTGPAASVVGPIIRQEKQIAADLGLVDPQDIHRIFKRPSIRFTGPLAGFAGEIGRLPILGTREADIPVLTDLADRVFQAASDGYYGNILKVKNLTLEKAQAGSKGAQAILAIGDSVAGLGNTLVNQLGGNVSRRVQASGKLWGSAEKRDFITDMELAKDALRMKLFSEVNFATGPLRKLPNVTKEHLDGFYRDAYDLIESNMMKDRPSAIPADIPGTMEMLETKWNKAHPGLGTEGRKFAERVTNDFDVFAKREQEAGITRNTIEGYVYHMFKHPGGPESPQFKALLHKMQGTGENIPDFTMDRVFETARKAESEGFVIDRNLERVFAARKFAHDKVMLEKDFAERMAYQHALPQPVYQWLSQEAAKASGLMQSKAIRAMRRYGTNINPETLEAELRHFMAPGQTLDDVLVKGKKPGGGALTPQNYENLKIANARALEEATAKGMSLDDYFKAGLGTDIRSLEQSKAMGLTFTKDEEAAIKAGHELWHRSVQMNAGRAGENALARAGAVKVSEFVKQRFLKNLTPEEQIFWHGALPESFARAVDESYQMAGELSHYSKKLDDTEGIKKPLRGILSDFYKRGHRLLRAGQTIYWPGYWMRNLVSSQFQGGYLANAFEQLSIPNVIRAHGILKGADAVDMAGKVIPHRQLMAELVAGGHSPLGTSITDTANLLTTYGDMINELTGGGKGGAIPGLSQMLKSQPTGPFRKASDWALAKAGFEGVTDKYWEALPNLAGRLEAYGRQHLYINLRIAGHDAQSATRATNQLLVDYARGKTAVEKNFLNNMFFFYSFSRGQATNNFMALMRKPGALSQQYSAIKEFAEMMIDPATYEPYPDAEEAIRSTRSAEQIATYIGKNPDTGQPRLVTSLGLPVEDFSKWMTVYTPESTSMLDILNAGGRTASRTAQVAFSQVNPIAKGIFEDLIFKRNLYFDRPTSDKTLRKIAKWEADTNTVVHHLANAVPDAVWKGMDEGVRDYLGGVDNGDNTWTINPYAMAVLSYITPLVVPWANSRLLSTRKALTEPGVPASQKYLRLLLGAHVDEFDPDKSIAHDKLRRIEEKLAYGGLARTKRELALRQQFNPDEGITTAEEEEE